MKIFLVGGAVRDQLLNFPFTERDWVVVGATPEHMIQQGFRPVGKDFPVFLHPQTNEEYALARTERKTAPGYRGFTFHTDISVTLEEDLKRRDLTINAIAQDDDGSMIDPYGGQHDLKNKILRHVSDAFCEDPVRILRIARFAARYHHLHFSIAQETEALMHTMVTNGETQHLVAERIWQECHKALGERHPEVFFMTLKNCGAINDIFPELNMAGLEESLNNLMALSQTTLYKNEPAYTNDTIMRFAALCYNLDLPSTKQLCQRLGAPNTFKALALLVSGTGKKIAQADQLKAENIAKLLQQVDSQRKPERFHQLITCVSLIKHTLEEQTNNPQATIDFWQTAAEYYQRVKPQDLIAKGYTKAALGQAIKQERIHQLNHYITHYLKHYD